MYLTSKIIFLKCWNQTHLKYKHIEVLVAIHVSTVILWFVKSMDISLFLTLFCVLSYFCFWNVNVMYTRVACICVCTYTCTQLFSYTPLFLMDVWIRVVQNRKADKICDSIHYFAKYIMLKISRKKRFFCTENYCCCWDVFISFFFT